MTDLDAASSPAPEDDLFANLKARGSSPAAARVSNADAAQMLLGTKPTSKAPPPSPPSGKASGPVSRRPPRPPRPGEAGAPTPPPSIRTGPVTRSTPPPPSLRSAPPPPSKRSAAPPPPSMRASQLAKSAPPPPSRRAQELEIAVEVDAVSSPVATAPEAAPPSAPKGEPPSAATQVLTSVPQGNAYSQGDASASDDAQGGGAVERPTHTASSAAPVPNAVPAPTVPNAAPAPTQPMAASAPIATSGPSAPMLSAPTVSAPSLTSGPGPETQARIDEASREFLEETASAQGEDDDFGHWDAPTRELPTSEFEAPTLEQPAPAPLGQATLVLPNLAAPSAGPVASAPQPIPPQPTAPLPLGPRAGMTTQLGLGPVAPITPAEPAQPIVAAQQPIMPLDDYDEADDAPTRVVDAASVHLPPAADASVQSGLPPVPLAPRAPSFQIQDHHSLPPPQTSLAPVAAEQITLPPARRRSSAGWIAAGVLGLAAVVGLLFLIPNTGLAGGGEGELIVTVAGPGQSSVDMPRVLVDGQKRCDSSPCRVQNLDVGPHFVRVSAPGFKATTDLAVSVVAGEEAVLRVDLVAEHPTPVADNAASKDDDPAKPEELTQAESQSGKQEDETVEERASAAKVSTATKTASAASKPAGGKLPASSKPATPIGGSTLRISSIPISNVVVDGRPLGSTPKIVKVSPGAHSVVFISPTGRKARSVRVGAGQTQVVAVKF